MDISLTDSFYTNLGIDAANHDVLMICGAVLVSFAFATAFVSILAEKTLNGRNLILTIMFLLGALGCFVGAGKYTIPSIPKCPTCGQTIPNH